MLSTTLPLTHYWPHDGDEQQAVCGTPIADQDHQIVHSLEPTCPACRAYLDQADAALEAQLAAADGAFTAALADLDREVERICDVVLNAGLPPRPPRPPRYHARAGSFGSHRFRRTFGGFRGGR